MEDVHATEGKITIPTRFPTSETPGPTIFTLSITGRINKCVQHLYILQTSHTHSNSITTKRTLLQWDVTLEPVHQEKPLNILRRHLSSLTRTVTTRDVQNIKQQVNQLIKSQIQHQETIVHVISILNIIRYAM